MSARCKSLTICPVFNSLSQYVQSQIVVMNTG